MNVVMAWVENVKRAAHIGYYDVLNKAIIYIFIRFGAVCVGDFSYVTLQQQ